METLAAAPIFIELTLSEKAPAVADGVCTTQVTTLGNTLIPPHTQNGSALDASSHAGLMQGGLQCTNYNLSPAENKIHCC